MELLNVLHPEKPKTPRSAALNSTVNALTHENLFYFTYPDYLEDICYTEGPVRLLRNHLIQSVFETSAGMGGKICSTFTLKWYIFPGL